MKHSRPKRYTNWYLRDWMQTLGVSQTDLVARTEMSKTTISLLCDDRQDYRPEVIRDVAVALNIAPYELLMHPEDAMALRQLRRDALQVVRTTESFHSPSDGEGFENRTGTTG